MTRLLAGVCQPGSFGLNATTPSKSEKLTVLRQEGTTTPCLEVNWCRRPTRPPPSRWPEGFRRPLPGHEEAFLAHRLDGAIRRKSGQVQLHRALAQGGLETPPGRRKAPHSASFCVPSMRAPTAQHRSKLPNPLTHHLALELQVLHVTAQGLGQPLLRDLAARDGQQDVACQAGPHDLVADVQLDEPFTTLAEPPWLCPTKAVKRLNARHWTLLSTCFHPWYETPAL